MNNNEYIFIRRERERERERETVISQPFTCWFGKQSKINAYSMKNKHLNLRNYVFREL